MRSNFQNPITEDMDEFGKVGADMSHIQSQIIPIMTQQRVLRTRILKIENWENAGFTTVHAKSRGLYILNNCIGGNLLPWYWREKHVQSVLKLI